MRFYAMTIADGEENLFACGGTIRELVDSMAFKIEYDIEIFVKYGERWKNLNILKKIKVKYRLTLIKKFIKKVQKEILREEKHDYCNNPLIFCLKDFYPNLGDIKVKIVQKEKALSD